MSKELARRQVVSYPAPILREPFRPTRDHAPIPEQGIRHSTRRGWQTVTVLACALSCGAFWASTALIACWLSGWQLMYLECIAIGAAAAAYILFVMPLFTFRA